MQGGERKETTHCVWVCGRKLPFILLRKKVKNLNLRVQSGGRVTVSAPAGVDISRIREFVKDKGSWVFRHLDAAAADDSREGQPGREGFVFLGEKYPLIPEPAGGWEGLVFDGTEARLFMNDPEDTTVRKQLLRTWRRERAPLVFEQTLDRVHPLAASHGIERPSVTVRVMKSRWGSCSRAKKRITLNSELLRFPPRVIDCVVLHELAHFVHGGHDQAFYALLSDLAPDWREQRALLKAGRMC